MRSEIGEAALNGKVDDVKRLIGKHVRLDADTDGCIRNAAYYTPVRHEELVPYAGIEK